MMPKGLTLVPVNNREHECCFGEILYSYHCATAPVCRDEMTHNLELAQIT